MRITSLQTRFRTRASTASGASSFVALAMAAAVACATPSAPLTPPAPPPAPTANGAPGVDAPVLDPSDGGALALTCPTKAPFDTSIPGLEDQCTKRVLIAGLDGDRLKVSTDDGATWADSEIDPAMKDPYVFGYASGLGMIAAMTRAGIYTSTDAKRWTHIDVTGAYYFSGAVAFAGGRFASVGSGGTFGSDDGLTWTGYHQGEAYPSGAVADVAAYSVAFLGGVWLLAGDHDHQAIVRTSADGLAWSPNADIGSARMGSYVSVAASSERFVVVGGCCGSDTEGVVAYAADGKTWSAAVDKTRDLYFVASDGNRMLGFAQSQTLTSTDGATWTKLADGPHLESAVFDRGMWFARNVDAFFTSADGTAWKSVYASGKASYTGNLGVGHILK